MNPHEKALNGIFDDMDDFESKKMFGDKGTGGVSVTISVTPNGESKDLPEDHDVSMCKGGCAMHSGGTVPSPELESDIHSGYEGGDPEYKKGEIGMAEGGMVDEEMKLPPFLRKKKKV